MAVMITGASGLLGSNLCLAARDAGLDVIAVGGSRRLRPDVGVSVSADLTKPGSAEDLLRKLSPEAVIHTAASVDVARCETDPAYAQRLNAHVPEEMAQACRRLGIRLVHISTDAVFSGESAQAYGEDDPTGPINEYGRAKLEGERRVLRVAPDALVVRTTIYGWSAQDKQSLGEFFVTRLSRGERTNGFADVWMSPILVNDLANVLLQLVAMETSGILHVAGHDSVSKADFGRRIALAFGYPPDLIESVNLSEYPLSAPRPLRPCLSVARVEAMLGRMPTVDEGVAHFRELRDSGLPRRLRSLLEVD